MKVVKVEVTREDGTVMRLTGKEAVRWGELIAGQASFCSNHGVPFPSLDWQITPPPAYVPVAWCAYCAPGGPHVLGVTPCPICARTEP
jgi:hypothetical protein